MPFPWGMNVGLSDPPSRPDNWAGPPRVLICSGIDPGGGAGLIADVRAIQSAGCWPCGIATCVTVQDRRGLHSVHGAPAESIAAGIDSVLVNGPVHAIKVGLVPDPETAELLARALGPLVRAGVPMVLDPVLSATAGGMERELSRITALREALLPIATVCTPNLPELAELAEGRGVPALLEAGCHAVVATGGHAEGEEIVDELWVGQSSAKPAEVIRGTRVPVDPVHGTGCVFSSSLAAGLALREPLQAAFHRARGAVRAGLEELLGYGPGDGLPRDLPVVGGGRQVLQDDGVPGMG